MIVPPNLELPTPDLSMSDFCHATQSVISELRDSVAITHNGTKNTYHNLGHTDNVIADVVDIASLARLEGLLSLKDVYELAMAGAGHDVFHEPGHHAGYNETMSASMTNEVMSKHGIFDGSSLKTVGGLILSTIVNLENPGNIDHTTSVDAPDCAPFLQDADLASFGKPLEDFLKESSTYMRELVNHGVIPRFDEDHALEFLLNNLKILESLKYRTPQANERFPNLERNSETLYWHLVLKRSSKFLTDFLRSCR